MSHDLGYFQPAAGLNRAKGCLQEHVVFLTGRKWVAVGRMRLAETHTMRACSFSSVLYPPLPVRIEEGRARVYASVEVEVKISEARAVEQVNDFRWLVGLDAEIGGCCCKPHVNSSLYAERCKSAARFIAYAGFAWLCSFSCQALANGLELFSLAFSLGPAG